VFDGSIHSMQNQLSRGVVVGHEGQVLDRRGHLLVPVEFGHSVSAGPHAVVLFDKVEEPDHWIRMRPARRSW
jgi:hypothetical protein